MAIKDILVHVGDGDASARRIAAACALAARHEAHLTGLYTLFVPPMPGYVASQIGAELLERQREGYTDRARHAHAAFEREAKRTGVANEWRRIEGRPEETLKLSARYCDLLLLGLKDEEDGDDPNPLAGSVVLQSGKPVLLIPPQGAPAQLGRHVAIGWDGKREAVRAVDEAMPLLEAAERVDVLVVDPRPGAEGHGAAPGADICRHLARHGVRAEAQSMSSDGHGAGHVLLERAVANGADLLVMGAYGHARWREVVLGGATEFVLHHAHIPVLMAH